MSAQFYNLSFNSYQEKLCCGFSNLQQKEEFVDMTLAAEGYLVKVHKSIVALASPYLKEMISSVPCDHPIIFLGNIKYEVLTLIVEYIYTGEIQVPMDSLQSFLKAATDLHLLGLNNITTPQEQFPGPVPLPVPENNMQSNIPIEESHQPEFVTDPIPNIVIDNTNLNQYCPEADIIDNATSGNDNLFEDILQFPIGGDTDMTDISTINTTDLLPLETNEIETNEAENITNISVNTDYKPQQYSVSSRGSLQLIMNRYIYLVHHTSYKGFKRRWRCLDYRRKGCKAFIDTEGDIIMKRSIAHNHPYHDDKILKKAEQNLIYGSLKSIEIHRMESRDQTIADNDAEDSI